MVNLNVRKTVAQQKCHVSSEYVRWKCINVEGVEKTNQRTQEKPVKE